MTSESFNLDDIKSFIHQTIRREKEELVREILSKKFTDRGVPMTVVFEEAILAIAKSHGLSVDEKGSTP